MTNSVIPFPGLRAELRSEAEGLISLAAHALLVEVAAQPVPDRLHRLAMELGDALGQRHSEFCAHSEDMP